MPNRMRNQGICFLILSMLLVSGCVITFNSNFAYAKKDLETLESVAIPAGISEGVAQIKIGGLPQFIYGDLSESDLIYILNREPDTSNGTVAVFNTTTNTLIKRIPVGIEPRYIFGDLSKSVVYVTNWGSDTVSKINTTTNNVENIPVGVKPWFIYGDLSESDNIYITSRGGLLDNQTGSVSILDTSNNKVTRNVTVGKNPKYIYGDLRVSDNIYVANSGSNTVSVVNTTSNNVTDTIHVGDGPSHIYGQLPPPMSITGREGVRYIYVANSESDSVSVIDIHTNNVSNIMVGDGPRYIYGDLSHSSKIYVANSGNNSVSVIDTDNINIGAANNTVENIKVGLFPGYMYGDPTNSSYIYVASDDVEPDKISVINTKSNDAKNITVGKGPRYIFGDLSESDALYVANSNIESASISIVNSKTNKVLAGVTFDVSPSNTGEITCHTDLGDLDVPINHFVYVSSGTKCAAEPNKGFEFSSWGEILDDNSTRTIIATSGTPWWAAILDAVDLNPDDPAATLPVNQFGNLTAYFRALPPPIPSEYLIPLYGIVISTVVGLSIPSIITWRKTKKQTSRLNSYHKEMTSLYDDGRLDENDTEHLNLVNKNVINAYSEGKINNEQYSNLKNEISALYEEIYRKRVDALKDFSIQDLNREVDIEKIQEAIKDAYSKGKISELHYNLLNERVTKITSKS